MKPGLIIAGISSAIVLSLDIAYGGVSSLNEYFQNDLALSAMFLVVSWTLGFYVRHENNHIEQLTNDANRDGLTGLYNHRFLHRQLEELFAKCVEEKRELSLLIFDFDYFKNYNDMYGHQKGDELLKEISALIKGQLRSDDLFCRYGGDEFCVILPDTGKARASDIAQRINSSVGRYQPDSEIYMPDTHVTVSIGVSTLDKETATYKALIDSADTALYRAKFLHRNRVEVYSSVFDHLTKSENDRGVAECLRFSQNIISIINAKDAYTFKHVERVVDYCRVMADYMGLDEDEKRCLIYGAHLHDIGKLNTPKILLVADRKLTDDEWTELKKYPRQGAGIITQLEGFKDVCAIVLHHRERYDGAGYPSGLPGEKTLYLARLLNIVESFDAMTNERPYQKTKTFDEAFEELERCRHSQFDPILTDLFIEMLKSQ